MKIRSNVKSGGSINHNEKTVNDSADSIEQKKTLGRKLRLSKETVLELKPADLKKAVGGAYVPRTYGWECS